METIGPAGGRDDDRLFEAAAGVNRATTTDVAGLVTGAAVASVHFRDFPGEYERLTFFGLALATLAFVWLAVTAAGPFVFLVRRGRAGWGGLPGSGPNRAEPDELLWAAFGIPWAVAALYRSAAGSLSPAATAAYGRALWCGLAAASALALLRLARNWNSLDAAAAAAAAGGLSAATPPALLTQAELHSPRRLWTARVGQVVAVAWPLQFGIKLLVTSTG